MEAIHLFVEVLGEPSHGSIVVRFSPLSDAFFENVCELDLVFNFYKVQSNTLNCFESIEPPCQVYAILDEVFLAGEIEETSKEVVLARLEELEKLE